MSRYGYGYLTKEDLIAFQEEFNKGVWAEHDISSVYHKERKLPEQLEKLSLFQVMKLRAIYSIEHLVETIGANLVVLGEQDQKWDRWQRILENKISGFELEGTPAQQEAAAILRDRLLFEGGLGHTKFPTDQEAAFGKAQVALARSRELAPLVALLGLAPLIQSIEEQTNALDAARTPGDTGASDPRSVRIAKATAACALAINQIHGILDGLLLHATPSLIQTLRSLLAPFEELRRTGQSRRPKTSPPQETKEEPSHDQGD